MARAARARALLPDRFQEAVDAAAMVAGLIGSDDYTEQMRMDARACGDDLQHEVDTETVQILSEWDEDLLKATIRSGGVEAERRSPVGRALRWPRPSSARRPARS